MAGSDCSGDRVLAFTPASAERSVTVVIGASTNYDQSKGNAAANFFFKGPDPAGYVESVTSDGAAEIPEALLRRHLDDYHSLGSLFSLDLPDPHRSASKETAPLIADYNQHAEGDPFVEGLLFDYSRHLLICSSRDNSLPANLQGRWTEEIEAAWSGDYHININLQMNYWHADQTGLWETEPALWNYMRQTLVPRGTETARLLYNAPGWVTHHGSNIYGYTAMGSDASWANYPAAPAWMMQHVWDHFDYTQDTNWLSDVAYPMMKGVAEFWLSQLQDDVFTGDGSLVVNPCNSPEHGPTTFGCAHYQQQIHQVFDATLAGASIIGEGDSTFVRALESALTRLDKGLHYTSWGGHKEWKLPDSWGVDTESDHRHLSQLTGWYPGYSIASFQDGYLSTGIQSAVRKTLTARGNGTAGDADASWAKVWRAACWARLNDTDQA
ncbi:related to Alpha-fucosidase A [Cephalotrichum gorgonifer]|uniref:Related to Alpha-fucosidase A n=1 Tax=Cephalotrichum gorgonifer TaxID=2041049 RepID=A0AAE8MZ90_9PEZI|nr:related to Alpha-fucosidase A [Cephalotrichum gorgonifer]